jgi:hypothetical protein
MLSALRRATPFNSLAAHARLSTYIPYQLPTPPPPMGSAELESSANLRKDQLARELARQMIAAAQGQESSPKPSSQ